MRSIEQNLWDNGPGIGLPLDNTPFGDSHNLTGRALPEGVEEEWTPFESENEDDFTYAPLATYEELDSLLPESYPFVFGDEECE